MAGVLDYLPASISFIIGLFAGFQGVYERCGKDSLLASRTFPGTAYLLSRGGVPAALYSLAFSSNLISSDLWLWAAAIGSGAEIFLRSQFYIRQTEVPQTADSQQPGQLLELVRGPLDLLRWYQNLFLGLADNQLAEGRRVFVEKHMPKKPFEELCDLVLTNKDAFNDPSINQQIENITLRFKEEFLESGDTSDLRQRKYALKLGYRIRSIAGQKGFVTLLRE